MRSTRSVAFGALAMVLTAGACSAPSVEVAATPGTQTSALATPSNGDSDSSVVAAEELEFTGPPRVPYVDGGVLTYPDGRTMELSFPQGRQRGFDEGPVSLTSITAGEGGQFLATERGHHEVDVMHRVRADGTVLDTWVTSAPAARSDGGQVAWVSTPNGPYRRGPTILHVGDRTRRLDTIGQPGELRWEGERLFFVASGDRGGLRWSPVDQLDEPTEIKAPYQSRLTSPDEQHVVVMDSPRNRLTVRDRSGEVILRIRDGRLFGPYLGQPHFSWEDDTHLLVSWHEQDRRAVVRIDLAGEISRATGWGPQRRGWDTYVFLVQ